MENIAWVILISIVGGVAVLIWFLFKPEEKCSQCGRPLNKYSKSHHHRRVLNDCNSCICQGEDVKEYKHIIKDLKKK